MSIMANIVIAVTVHVCRIGQVKDAVNACWNDPKYSIPGIHKDVAKNHRGYTSRRSDGPVTRIVPMPEIIGQCRQYDATEIEQDIQRDANLWPKISFEVKLNTLSKHPQCEQVEQQVIAICMHHAMGKKAEIIVLPLHLVGNKHELLVHVGPTKSLPGNQAGQHQQSQGKVQFLHCS